MPTLSLHKSEEVIFDLPHPKLWSLNSEELLFCDGCNRKFSSMEFVRWCHFARKAFCYDHGHRATKGPWMTDVGKFPVHMDFKAVVMYSRRD